MSVPFGLKMKQGAEYSCCTPRSLHISGVAIDEGEIARIYLIAKKCKFIVATLSQMIPQATLDLNFAKGEKIMFTAEGNATVSMLGYWTDEKNKVPLFKKYKSMKGNDANCVEDKVEKMKTLAPMTNKRSL